MGYDKHAPKNIRHCSKLSEMLVYSPNLNSKVIYESSRRRKFGYDGIENEMHTQYGFVSFVAKDNLIKDESDDESKDESVANSLAIDEPYGTYQFPVHGRARTWRKDTGTTAFVRILSRRKPSKKFREESKMNAMRMCRNKSRSWILTSAKLALVTGFRADPRARVNPQAVQMVAMDDHEWSSDGLTNADKLSVKDDFRPHTPDDNEQAAGSHGFKWEADKLVGVSIPNDDCIKNPVHA
jgi:hypothetical protein